MEQLIRINEVMKMTGLAKSTLWAWIADGRFPKGTKLSARVTVWKFSEIQSWIEERITGGAA